MELLLPILFGLTGLLVGFGLAFWIARSSASRRFDEGARSRDAELALLNGELERARQAQVLERSQQVAQDQRAQALQSDYAKCQAELAGVQAKMAATEQQVAELQLRIRESSVLIERNTELEKQLSEVAARAQAQAQNAADKLQWLAQAREVLTEQFQSVSASILDSKAQHFSERQSEQLQHLLKPFREQIETFQRDVRDASRQELEGRTEIKGELKQLRDLNQNLSSEAHALTQALRGDSKKRGNWGELVLERLLELAGLRPGREFDVQPSVQGVDRQRQFPDVILRLTDDRSLVIDSKLSLIAFEQLTASENDDDRERHRKDHRAAMRTHIESLGQKRYSESPDLRSPEFVVMFVPIEAAYLEAVGNDDSLYELAISRKVIVASPGMLLGLLRIVHELWRVQERQKNAEEIARLAGSLYDNFARIADNLQTTLGRIDGARDELQEAIKRMQTGRGNVLGQVEKLRALGAKTNKALPAQWQGQLEAPATDTPEASIESGDTTESSP
ncbi:MAG: DNA recombination protein RmuC [Ahniella sp.]|nr:DNA recombination protein RmuC [Ahniella sp.]